MIQSIHARLTPQDAYAAPEQIIRAEEYPRGIRCAARLGHAAGQGRRLLRARLEIADKACDSRDHMGGERAP